MKPIKQLAHLVIGGKPCGCSIAVTCIHDKEFQKRMKQMEKSLKALLKEKEKQEKRASKLKLRFM